MKYLKRKILNDIIGSPLKQKAVAFALLIKTRTNDSSVIRNFTTYKLQKLTSLDSKGKKRGGMAYKTIKKYLDVLISMGLAEIKGRDLYIKKMSSSSRHRNIDISVFKINNKNKDIYNQIRELLFLVIQAHKDFIHSLLRLRKEPTRGTDFRKVRRLCKKCCDDPNADYEEHGLTYKRIARQIGCCIRTAFTIVKDAVRRKWCVKENHCTIDYLPGVNFADIPGYSFTSFNYGFILRPNTYVLSRAWSCALGTDAGACAGAYVHAAGCVSVGVRMPVRK